MIDAMLNSYIADQRMDAFMCKPGTHSNDAARLRFGQIPFMHTPMVFHHSGIHSTKSSQKSLFVPSQPQFSNARGVCTAYPR